MFFVSASGVFAVSVSITQNPRFVDVGESVVFTVSSPFINTQTSLIRWYQDGSLVLEGLGKNSFSIPSVEGGVKVDVEVAEANSTQILKNSITVQTDTLDLLWESPTSYTPPFYKGKSLPNIDSTVDVTAIVPGKNPESLLFSWEKDFTNSLGANGLGRDNFSYRVSVFDDFNSISVRATSIDNVFTSEKVKQINYVQPKVLFYRYNSSLGTLFNRALLNNTRFAQSSTQSIEAVPFYASIDSINDSGFSMDWKVGSVAVEKQNPQNRLRFSVPTRSGESIISVSVDHENRKYHDGVINLRISY